MGEDIKKKESVIADSFCGEMQEVATISCKHAETKLVRIRTSAIGKQYNITILGQHLITMLSGVGSTST